MLSYNNLQKMKKFHAAITVHPVKNPDTMLSVHHFYQSLKHQTLRAEEERVMSELKAVCLLLANRHVKNTGSHATNCSILIGNETVQ